MDSIRTHLQVQLRPEEHGWNWNKTKQPLLFGQQVPQQTLGPFCTAAKTENKEQKTRDSFLFVDPVYVRQFRINGSMTHVCTQNILHARLLVQFTSTHIYPAIADTAH